MPVWFLTPTTGVTIKVDSLYSGSWFTLFDFTEVDEANVDISNHVEASQLVYWAVEAWAC